ncbi:MAG TPA: PD-(D/E)XK nuclease family protein [Gemmatimonadaceae bacterium]|nr:PD-(D/E)XK nuclease family protein [Gemmatimonadaceae bacterium]
MRRASAEGLPWDEVEIATTDPDTYGIALDALCQRVDMRATMLHGIPITRTRLGRALERWLNWLDGDLPASILREALEAGDTRPSNSGASAAVLARELRRLRIGWGLTRYQQAARDLEQQSVSPSVRRYEDESDEEFGQRTERRRRIAVALHDFVQDLLVCLPETSGDGTEQGRYSCGDLAAATLRWTRLLSVDDGPESLTLDRLRSRLEQLVKVGGPPSEMAIAVASLRESLADLRAWPAQTSDRKPWSANGGMVHLTDIRHAGITGRRRIFVVGLDARRASSGRRSDPLLTDELRTQLGGNRLPTLDDRRNESAFALASALAALRGRVTLSYAVSDGGDRPEASPAPVLLQSLRLMRADPSLSYRELRAELSPPISAVPTPTSLGKPAPLDRRDVWLDTVAKGSLLLDARNLAREGFPGLSGGLLAAERSQAPEANEYHGVIARAAAAFDPLCTPGREMSPSELEKLAVCPLQWFYVYGLALKPPHDPEYDPDRWLDAMQRGSLLHDVYQSFVTEYRGRQSDIQAPEARDHILRMVDVAIAEYREIVPVPGDSVFAAEADELRSAAMTFLEMERELGRNGDGAEWLDVEFAFGRLTKPAAYRLVDGRELRVRGRADRVDRLTNGTLRVVDYKTGSTWAYKKDSKVGPFRGGRQLQPTVYAAVIQSLLGADVSSFEYRFPTAKGVGQITSYPAVDLQIGQSIVSDYIGLVRSGQFIPTNDSSDCKYCDASQICRVGRDDDGWVEVSPRAAWAKANGETIEAYSIMRKHRLPPVK